MSEFARQEEEVYQRKRQEAAKEKAQILKEWEWQTRRRDSIQKELGLEKIG